MICRNMIRGTTPTIKFILPEAIPFDLLHITFVQEGETILEKNLQDVEITDNLIELNLSQEDTLAFNRGLAIWVQLRGTVENSAYASKIMRISVSEILEGGVI